MECISAVFYTPYHVLVAAACAVVVWGGTQTWTFTQRLSPLRAAVCLGLLAISIAFLWTQTANPFLYFQF
jgi:hypothetical protein